MRRILVIRGGAIGDFVLTLPAIKLLRDGFPEARIEILGYKHIIALAENRFYAQATRSIEYSALASFFARGAELPNELSDYFHRFDLVVSYLFDPDHIFRANLSRCGVEYLLQGPSKLQETEHAAVQLAAPMRELDLTLRDPAAEIFPSGEDRAQAAALVPETFVALHPGSGSAMKNWPMENWIELGKKIAAKDVVVVAGEAEDLTRLRAAWQDRPVRYLQNLPLPILAAVLARASHFIGHDSGISHIAAAVGTPCTLLFGPSNPDVWAPKNASARILKSPTKSCAGIALERVIEALDGVRPVNSTN